MFDHLKEINLSYCAHMKQAMVYYAHLQICATKLLIHAVIPDAFPSDVSSRLQKLNEEMQRAKKTNSQ